MTTDKVREDRYHKRYDYAFFDGGFIQFWIQDIVRLRSFNGGFHSMNQSERIVTTNATTTPSSTKDSFNFRVNTGVKTSFVRVHSMNLPVPAPTTIIHVIEHVLPDYK